MPPVPVLPDPLSGDRVCAGYYFWGPPKYKKYKNTN